METFLGGTMAREMAAASGEPAELDEAMPPGCMEGVDWGLEGVGG